MLLDFRSKIANVYALFMVEFLQSKFKMPRGVALKTSGVAGK